MTSPRWRSRTRVIYRVILIYRERSYPRCVSPEPIRLVLGRMKRYNIGCTSRCELKKLDENFQGFVRPE